jgi:hypothetical protein
MRVIRRIPERDPDIRLLRLGIAAGIERNRRRLSAALFKLKTEFQNKKSALEEEELKALQSLREQFANQLSEELQIYKDELDLLERQAYPLYSEDENRAQ